MRTFAAVDHVPAASVLVGPAGRRMRIGKPLSRSGPCHPMLLVGPFHAMLLVGPASRTGRVLPDPLLLVDTELVARLVL